VKRFTPCRPSEPLGDSARWSGYHLAPSGSKNRPVRIFLVEAEWPDDLRLSDLECDLSARPAASVARTFGRTSVEKETPST
jgi:hypothetical protein